jgi:hypothetical protein
MVAIGAVAVLVGLILLQIDTHRIEERMDRGEEELEVARGFEVIKKE